MLNTDIGQKLATSGGTVTGALNFANATWNQVGDDCYFGDHNQAGAFCVKGLTGTPQIRLYDSDDSFYASVLRSTDIIGGTCMAPFTDGVATISTATLGLSKRPDALVLTAQSCGAYLQYQMDSSDDDSISIKAWWDYGVPMTDGWEVRFAWIAINI